MNGSSKFFEHISNVSFPKTTIFTHSNVTQTTSFYLALSFVTSQTHYSNFKQLCVLLIVDKHHLAKSKFRRIIEYRVAYEQPFHGLLQTKSSFPASLCGPTIVVWVSTNSSLTLVCIYVEMSTRGVYTSNMQRNSSQIFKNT